MKKLIVAVSIMLCTFNTVFGAEQMTAEVAYEVLGISNSSDLNTIKRTYKKLALRWHPDKNPEYREHAEAKFKKIGAAYEYLVEQASRGYSSSVQGPINVSFQSCVDQLNQILLNDLILKLNKVMNNNIGNIKFNRLSGKLSDQSVMMLFDIISAILELQVIFIGSDKLKEALLRKDMEILLKINDLFYTQKIIRSLSGKFSEKGVVIFKCIAGAILTLTTLNVHARPGFIQDRLSENSQDLLRLQSDLCNIKVVDPLSGGLSNEGKEMFEDIIWILLDTSKLLTQK